MTICKQTLIEIRKEISRLESSVDEIQSGSAGGIATERFTYVRRQLLAAREGLMLAGDSMDFAIAQTKESAT